ncbi:TetR family transcriptional regulator [Kribbella pratensis]|jgi:AcrR family transcriptional regulator|uniref:TetR family transcriptional regulator n=1 Tax=Kribbella pratensis TaxID=2512112 RepID=A0ABY2F6B4_9ACTN|nr:TetR/AcrR family transcriptional regulator [Kribbella pratensis]TDW83913.1 TetR family transcriptional regulator [Kribbella pratensis]
MANSRGPYAKGVAKRAEILRAALEVIARHGYRKTSTRELAAAAGLSEAGMLHYFGSKEQLFEAVLRARDEADLARFETGDPIDNLTAIVRHNGSVPGLVQLYSTFSAEAGDPEHGSHQYFVERYAGIRAALADAVRARQAAGTLNASADPETIATLLIALSDGLQVQSQYELQADTAELFSHLLDLLGGPTRDS